MQHIVAGILSLTQYIEEQKKINLDHLRPNYCLHCGKSGLRLHGCYPRKADRSSNPGESLNPIFIQRYFCPNCRHTCSVLPECIPSRRWYLWDVQQAALTLLLAGKSAYAAAKEIVPSRHTISRWKDRLIEQFLFHKDVMCVHFFEFGRATDCFDFWKTCLNKILLSQAMRLCHVAEVSIP